jgi:hypothetical protein
MEMQAKSKSDTRKTAPVYLVWSGELMIDAAPAEVWRHALNYASWQEYSTIRHLSGKPGEEGELVMLKKEESGLQFPPYYARTIKLDPGRRVIWKVYLEPQSYEMDFFGIVDFRVEPAQGQTRFAYECLYEFIVPYEDESELEAFRRQQRASFDAVFQVTFPKLKKLAESRT